MEPIAARSVESRSRLACVALIVVAALSFALLRAPFVSVPLERDEGEYAYIAQRLLAGDVPYRDAFDQKPPAIFFTYAVAFALLGQSIEAIHVFMYLWSAATAALLFALVRRLADGPSAAFSVLIFSIAATDPILAATAANTEIFMLLPLVASTLCLVRALDESGRGWWLGSGALVAAACWFKPVAATHAVFLVSVAAAALLSRCLRPSPRALARALLLLGLGGAAASAPVIAYLVLSGAWEAFVDAVLLHNLAYSQRIPLSVGAAILARQLAQQAPSFGVFWAVAACALVAPPLAGRRTWALLAAWVLTSAAGVSVGLYFRSHYFVQVLPALAALGGVACGAAARWLLGRRSPTAAWAGLAALLPLLIAPPLVANREVFWAGSPEEISRRIYGFNPFPESLTVADYIRRTSDPDDSVYVIGSEPQIFFYARRRSATRYIFFYPLTADHPGARERQREVMQQVDANRPLYAVWAHVATSLAATPQTDRFVFQETVDMLNRDYRLEFVGRGGPRRSEESGEEPAGGFEFVYAPKARAALREAIEHADREVWLAVYRRAR